MVLALLAVTVAIVIGIVCYKRRKQQRVTQHAVTSHSKDVSHTTTPPENYEEMRSVNIGASHLAPIETKANVVYGYRHGKHTDSMAYEEIDM